MRWLILGCAAVIALGSCSVRRTPSVQEMYAAVDPACGRECRLLAATCAAGCRHDGACWSAWCFPAEAECLNSCPIAHPDVLLAYPAHTDTNVDGLCDQWLMGVRQEERLRVLAQWRTDGRISDREYARCVPLP